ncbi:MAG: YihY/virulence factor BrkB family protein [Candidatus Hydrogenedentota bacterium]
MGSNPTPSETKAATRGMRLKRMRSRLGGVFHRTLVDRLIGLSAEIAFYEFFAILPFIVFSVNCIALLPSEGLIMMFLPAIAPAPAAELIKSWYEGIQDSSGVTLMSIGALVTLWVGSTGIGSFIEAFSVINRRRSRAGILKRYLVRIVFTIGGAIGLVCALFAWVVGPWLVASVFEDQGYWETWELLWNFIRLPLGVSFFVLGLMIFYHFLSFSGRAFRANWPGACLSALVFFGVSHLFSLYIRYFANFNATYGSLGAIVLLLLWLQTLNFSVLVGEFWNAQLQADASRAHD